MAETEIPGCRGSGKVGEKGEGRGGGGGGEEEEEGEGEGGGGGGDEETLTLTLIFSMGVGPFSRHSYRIFRGREEYTYRYTATTKMTPALRWATM